VVGKSGQKLAATKLSYPLAASAKRLKRLDPRAAALIWIQVSPQDQKEGARACGRFKLGLTAILSLRAVRMATGALRPVHLALFATIAAMSIFRGVGAFARLVSAFHGWSFPNPH